MNDLQEAIVLIVNSGLEVSTDEGRIVKKWGDEYIVKQPYGSCDHYNDVERAVTDFIG